MEFQKLSDLRYICKLVYSMYRIPIFYLDESGEIAFEFSSNYIHNPKNPSKHDLLNKLFSQKGSQIPIFRGTIYLENFFTIGLYTKEELRGMIIVGPVLYSPLSDETIEGIFYDLGIVKEKEEMAKYFQSLPILSNLKFINLSMVFYYMLFQQKLDITDIIHQNKLLNKEETEVEQPYVKISESREGIAFHPDPIYEKRIFHAIKEGRKDEVVKHLKILPEKGVRGVLSKSSFLRSKKNLAIAGITLATRAATEGGVHPEIAYTLSDLFIQNLEELTDSHTIDSFLENAFYEFALRVERSKKQNLSKPIILCQNYIFTHLYENITLSQLAKIVAMNPSYLSVLFKKEVGISLREYIQRERIKEAKKLMTYTNYSISEIYTLLNFHDQSYFSKVFKKFTGITPKQYKDNGDKHP